MAFVWKDKKSRVWYLDYTPTGGKRVRKRIGTSKQAADLALKEIEYQLSFDRAGVSIPDVTLGYFFERYEQTTRPKLRDKSWKRYRAIMDHFWEFLGPSWSKLKLQQLNRERFEQYVAWRRTGHGASNGKNKKCLPAKTKTVNTELDVLASMLNKAVEWNYLTRNPAKSISRLKEDDRKPFRFFSIEEIKLLRMVADLLENKSKRLDIHQAVEEFVMDLDELILEVLVSNERVRNDTPCWFPNGRLIVDYLLMTGARADEVLSLEWSWLDLKRGVVSYRRRDNWVPKGTERDIALKPELIKKLKSLKRQPGQPRVFLDRTGKPIPPRTFERGIQRLIKLCRLPHASLHDYRHTFASHLAMASVPLPTIQKLLGHKDIQTVMIYAHLSQDHVRKSVNVLPF